MQSRFQVILSLAIIACFVCMTYALPVDKTVIPAGLIKTPRNTNMVKRQASALEPMEPYNTSGEPTMEEALAANGGSTAYQFNYDIPVTDTNNDGLLKMEGLNQKAKEKAEKKKKKEQNA